MITPKKSRKAFTLIEILMSLVILAMLLSAAALAINASAISYTAYESIFKAMNTARQSLLRITTDLRSATAVALIGAGAGDDPDNTQCSMVTADGRDITYQYDGTDDTLYLVDNSAGNSYVLCENVTAMSFNRATVPGDPTKVRNVRIIITVAHGSVSQTIPSAAVIRKNM